MMNANKRRTHPQPRDDAAAAAAIHWAEQSRAEQRRAESKRVMGNGKDLIPHTPKASGACQAGGRPYQWRAASVAQGGCRGRGQFGAQFSSVNRHRQRQLTEAETEEDADWGGPYRSPLAPSFPTSYGVCFCGAEAGRALGAEQQSKVSSWLVVVVVVVVSRGFGHVKRAHKSRAEHK